jgi:Ca-activated chloride channel homolog
MKPLSTPHMNSHKTPHIELVPIRTAVTSDRETTLDVLIKITPPTPELTPDRPPLNLGLVIDRSGSMSGEKIDYARQAACYAVEQLLPSDRVSVAIFDDRVDILVPTTLAIHKADIVRHIKQIRERGSTALHAGWVEGGLQVGQHYKAEHLNRIILLSDGLANVGETNPDAIAQDVHGLSRRGISTTTMGLGNDYSEDLLEAMARSGDGNFYHIESPQQLPQIFQAELNGLMATLGHKVSLGITPQGNVTLVDILNDLERTEYGRLKLPNLVVGNPIAVVIRLKIPACPQTTDLCQFRVAWDDPNQEDRQIQRTTLRLPVLPSLEFDTLPSNPEVQQQVALLMAARAREEAIRQIDQGRLADATARLEVARGIVMSAPMSPAMLSEVEALKDLESDLTAGDAVSSRKKAKFQSFNLKRNRSS